jgi:hypothetical protein
MFSNVSARHYRLAGLNQLPTQGLSPTLFVTVAPSIGLSAANMSVQSARGLILLSWQRMGGVQCGRSVSALLDAIESLSILQASMFCDITIARGSFARQCAACHSSTDHRLWRARRSYFRSDVRIIWLTVRLLRQLRSAVFEPYLS